MPHMKKVCPKCKKEKSHKAFNKCAKAKDGLQHCCRKCAQETAEKRRDELKAEKTKKIEEKKIETPPRVGMEELKKKIAEDLTSIETELESDNEEEDGDEQVKEITEYFDKGEMVKRKTRIYF